MENQQKPPTLKELKKTAKPIKNVNAAYKEKLTAIEKSGEWTTKSVGTAGFFFIIFFWTILWLLWNTLAPKGLRFDPYPAFVLWLFISNMIQLFLLPLLLIGQNLQNKQHEARSEIEFDLSHKEEKEIEAVLMYLEHNQGLLEKILEKLDKKNTSASKKR